MIILSHWGASQAGGYIPKFIMITIYRSFLLDLSFWCQHGVVDGESYGVSLVLGFDTDILDLSGGMMMIGAIGIRFMRSSSLRFLSCSLSRI